MMQHMPELTVRETLDFSRRVQGAGFRSGMLTPCRCCYWKGPFCLK